MNRFSKFLDIHRYDIHREFIDWTTNTSALLTFAVAWRQESSSRKVSGNRLNQMSASKYKSNRQSNARNIQDSIDDNHDVVWEQLTLFIHVYHTCSIIPNLMSRCGRKGLTRYYCEMEKWNQEGLVTGESPSWVHNTPCTLHILLSSTAHIQNENLSIHQIPMLPKYKSWFISDCRLRTRSPNSLVSHVGA